MMTETVILKSCPFCGVAAILGDAHFDGAGRVDGYVPQCSNPACRCYLYVHRDREKNIAAWNRRAPDPLTERLAEALRPVVNLVARDPETGELDDQLEGLSDGHAHELVWRYDDGENNKAAWISTRQLREARAALRAYEESRK